MKDKDLNGWFWNSNIRYNIGDKYEYVHDELIASSIQRSLEEYHSMPGDSRYPVNEIDEQWRIYKVTHNIITKKYSISEATRISKIEQL